MHIETIPLSKLVPSPANVRKAKTDITGLAASIMAHGLLQNLQVCPNGETYEVVAGGRRLAALKFLAKQKKIAADYGVACEVREGPDATEISLAENEMREAMHPADQFEAFKKLAEDGKGEEEIAARFGVTPHTVRAAAQAGRGQPEADRRLPQGRNDARLPDGLHGRRRSPDAGESLGRVAGLCAATG